MPIASVHSSFVFITSDVYLVKLQMEIRKGGIKGLPILRIWGQGQWLYRGWLWTDEGRALCLLRHALSLKTKVMKFLQGSVNWEKTSLPPFSQRDLIGTHTLPSSPTPVSQKALEWWVRGLTFVLTQWKGLSLGQRRGLGWVIGNMYLPPLCQSCRFMSASL